MDSRVIILRLWSYFPHFFAVSLTFPRMSPLFANLDQTCNIASLKSGLPKQTCIFQTPHSFTGAHFEEDSKLYRRVSDWSRLFTCSRCPSVTPFDWTRGATPRPPEGLMTSHTTRFTFIPARWAAFPTDLRAHSERPHVQRKRRKLLLEKSGYLD